MLAGALAVSGLQIVTENAAVAAPLLKCTEIESLTLSSLTTVLAFFLLRLYYYYYMIVWPLMPI